MPHNPDRGARDDRIRAQHMLEPARQARLFARNRSRSDLGADAMRTRALIHAIQEIGEAASRMTQPARTRIPDLPWSKIVGMRHRLVHGYWDIDLDLVWTVVTRDLPPLIVALEEAFKSWPLPQPPAN